MSHTLFLQIRTFLTSYIAFPNPVQADICALWAIGTHVFKRFDSYGYLVITASTKRAGKSVLAELLSFVSRKGVFATSLTASTMRRLVKDEYTIFFDEAESLNSEAASAQREYLNVGYRAGQMIPVSVGVDEYVWFPAYSPKAFILIGDVNDTLRDRSITIELRRGVAEKIYRRSVAETEGRAIQGAIERDDEGNPDPGATTELTRQIESIMDERFRDPFDAYTILEGREAEIWTAILTLAQIFCPQRWDAIIRTAVDISALKQTTEGQNFRALRKTAEDKTTEATFREKAMRDLASVLQDNEKAIHTETAILRMKAIPTAPWRTYKGLGLTPVMLSDLLDVCGCKSKSVKIKSVTKRGFQRADILSGVKRLGKKE